MALHLPSPPVNGFHAGPAFIHFYGLMYVIGITAAILITQRRWKAQGGDPALVGEVALWAVPAGIIGGRIYFDITTPKYIPHHWYRLFAVWDGGLGIWGAIALAAVVGAWRVRRHGASPVQFMDAVAPACWSPRRSGGSATTSTRNCSAGQPPCPGDWKSRHSSGPRGTRATPRSSRRSCI
jgi:prolipoprotein diacylglyceryltransferase